MTETKKTGGAADRANRKEKSDTARQLASAISRRIKHIRSDAALMAALRARRSDVDNMTAEYANRPNYGGPCVVVRRWTGSTTTMTIEQARNYLSALTNGCPYEPNVRFFGDRTGGPPTNTEPGYVVHEDERAVSVLVAAHRAREKSMEEARANLEASSARLRQAAPETIAALPAGSWDAFVAEVAALDASGKTSASFVEVKAGGLATIIVVVTRESEMGPCSVRLALHPDEAPSTAYLAVRAALFEAALVEAKLLKMRDEAQRAAPEKRSCDLHNDCDAADAEAKQAHGPEYFAPHVVTGTR